MKYSYTHEGKTYSVIQIKSGSILEVRRGDRTFTPEDRDRGFWMSVEDWKGSWPAGAVEVTIKRRRDPGTSSSNAATSSSNAAAPPASSRPVRKVPPPPSLASIIMKRYCIGVKSNFVELEDYNVRHIHSCAKELKEYTAKLAEYEKSPPITGLWSLKYDAAKDIIKYNTKVLSKDGIQQYLDGKLPFAPKIDCHSRVLVYHKGNIYPIYHNKQKDLVYVRIHGKGFFTPEELGITADSKFFKHTYEEDEFVPM